MAWINFLISDNRRLQLLSNKNIFNFITILGKAPDEDDIRIAKTTTPANDDQGTTTQEEP